MSVTGNKPLVSIGMPVYNGEDHIRQALDSLLAQDYENFELIISDNASTDATQQICLEYASKDPKIRYHRNTTNVGLIKNFNRVFGLSSGEYFMWAGHDDVWEPSFVSRCARALRRNPSVVLSYPQARFIGPDGEPINIPLSSFDTRAKGLDLVSRVHVHIWALTYPYPFQGLIRSSALKRTGLLEDILGADVVLLTELSLLGEFAQVPALLFHNRLPHHDDWIDRMDTFLNKTNKSVTTRWSALYWYWQMVLGHVRVVNTHVSGHVDKAILMVSVVFCVLVKYRWFLKLLLDVSKQKQGRNQLGS